MPFTYDANDPLAVVTTPPANESLAEKAAREEREAEARRISDLIDEDIKASRLAMKHTDQQIVKVLLLGQSGSGKSTTLKNFYMRFAPEEWKQERASWKAVIQLNIVRSVNTIVGALRMEMTDDAVHNDDSSQSPLQLTDKHRLLVLRLGPLRGVEQDLKAILGAGADELHPSMTATEIPSGRQLDDFSVRSWQSVLKAVQADGKRHSRTGRDTIDLQHTTDVIAGCREDMKSVWQDSVIQQMLERQQIQLEDSASFFIRHLDRLATREYEPTDDDVVRARLRTVGVQEHRMRIKEEGDLAGQDWLIYDVGGSRTSRAAWIPYFDSIDAIIFLAPVSCFDEKLAEDPRINRLEDSFILWKAICSSKLLVQTTLVVFLNKCDLLDKKIGKGVMVNKYLPSYGDRPNETSAVVRYLRQKFKDTLKQLSTTPRVCFMYPTTLVDAKGTSATFKSVRDGILREYLKKTALV